MSVWKGQGPPKGHLADVDEGIAVIPGLPAKGHEDRLVRWTPDILMVFAKQMKLKKIIEDAGFTGKTTPKQV